MGRGPSQGVTFGPLGYHTSTLLMATLSPCLEAAPSDPAQWPPCLPTVCCLLWRETAHALSQGTSLALPSLQSNMSSALFRLALPHTLTLHTVCSELPRHFRRTGAATRLRGSRVLPPGLRGLRVRSGLCAELRRRRCPPFTPHTAAAATATWRPDGLQTVPSRMDGPDLCLAPGRLHYRNFEGTTFHLPNACTYSLVGTEKCRLRVRGPSR